MIAQKTNPLMIQTYLHICRVIMCVGVLHLSPAKQPEVAIMSCRDNLPWCWEPNWCLMLFGRQLCVEMSRPNLWLCNVDTQARGNGDTAAPEGLTHWFGQQMWGASFERAGLKWGDLIKRCNFYSVKQLKFMSIKQAQTFNQKCALKCEMRAYPLSHW